MMVKLMIKNRRIVQKPGGDFSETCLKLFEFDEI